MANFYVAFELGLAVIPVLNKVDLPHADVDKTMMELNQMFEIEYQAEKELSDRKSLKMLKILHDVSCVPI